MYYPPSALSLTIFCVFVGAVLWLSFKLGASAKSAKGYYAAHGQVGWFVNGIAFAGDYLSAASFLGICGMIAFYGFDGFLYSIGYLAGWVVALFVIAEPIKRLGKFTFADALDAQFRSRGIKLAAAISTLVVSVFYLIPQMVGAGALVTPLLGLAHHWGVITVGIVVICIVVTAGMVSTTWVQFIKGSLLVFFCAILVVMILYRGLNVNTKAAEESKARELTVAASSVKIPWADKPYIQLTEPDGKVIVWRTVGEKGAKDPLKAAIAATTRPAAGPTPGSAVYTVLPTQFRTIIKAPGLFSGTEILINSKPHTQDNDIRPVGHIVAMEEGAKEGPQGPLSFFDTLQKSTLMTWVKDSIKESPTVTHEVYYPVPRKGSELLTPGGSPTFASVRGEGFVGKLNFLSLMLALFCGTAALPHILIRYYTVKDAASARKSTVVGIASIGFFYVLTLFLGLGAMTSGQIDPTDSNMAAPLLAKSFNQILFAIISAIAFTTVLGTVSGLIMAASGTVAHDLMTNFFKIQLDDHGKVKAGKIAAIVVGIIAIFLGIAFKSFNVTFLVGWAFNIAASANLPAIVMLLFWKGTTRQGITWSIVIGLTSSLAWILLSTDAFENLYGYTKAAAASAAPVPFNQPGIVTIPLSFIVLVVVSLLSKGHRKTRAQLAAHELEDAQR